MNQSDILEILKRAYDFGLWHGVHIPNNPLSEWSTEATKIRDEALTPLIDKIKGITNELV